MLLGCCDSLQNCPVETVDLTMHRASRTWKDDAFMCPAGTTQVGALRISKECCFKSQVLFVCDARILGITNGACGIDNIQLYYFDGDIESSQRRVCDS